MNVISEVNEWNLLNFNVVWSTQKYVTNLIFDGMGQI
jgi:hypothetical protein